MSEELINCPNCDEPIQSTAIMCRFCQSGLSKQHFRECPLCCEMVRVDALVCRYCSSEISNALIDNSQAAWIFVAEQQANNLTIQTTITEVIKGGVVVEISGLRGFVPGSQLRVKVTNPEHLIGMEIPVKILEVDANRRKLIVSHRLAVQEQKAYQRENVLATMQVGQTVVGEVVRIADFGAFIDLDGLEGLLPISEISWERTAHPSEFLKVGQKIDTIVLRVDGDKGHVCLSLKRMLPDPWEEIEDKLHEGQTVSGAVHRIESFGAFVQIYPGVDALLPTVEMSAQPNVKPEDIVHIGQELKVLIKRFSPKKHIMSLTLPSV
jgi:small subunit ribosomal protein S1